MKANAQRWLDWMKAEIAAGLWEYGNGQNATADMKAVLDEIARLRAENERLVGELETFKKAHTARIGENFHLTADLDEAREAIRYMVVEVGLSSDGLPKYEITGDPDRLRLTDVQPAVRAAVEGKR